MSVYMQRISAGVCVSCGNKPPGRTRRCESCRVEHNAKQGRRIAETVRLKICIDCGGDAMRGNARCKVCRERNRVKCLEWRVTE